MPDQSPFDTLAGTYDEDFTSSAIGLLQRKRVWEYLSTYVAPEKRLNILEINCGTGEDALRLASLGHNVTATDASLNMIEKALSKKGNANVQFSICPFDRLPATFQNQQFDLIFSNFGGLNCIDKNSLEKLSEDLSHLLNINGKLFFVLMGRCCIREITHYWIRGKFKTAFRRLKGSSTFGVNGHSIRVFYHSPGSLKKIFSPGFSHSAQHPVGLYIPPTYLESKYQNDAAKLEKLYRKELDHSSAAWANYADHYCIVFDKKKQPA